MLARPALRKPVSGEQAVAVHPYAGPEGLAFVIVDSVGKVRNQVPLAAGRKGVAVPCRTGGGGQFRPDAVVIQRDPVESGRGLFRFVAEAAPVARFRLFRGAGIELQLSGHGHQQNISQIRMARAAQVRVREAHDGGIVPAVACTEGVDFRLILSPDIMGNVVGVGTHLNAAEGDAGPGEGVPHSRRTDKWIYIRTGPGSLCLDQIGRQEGNHQENNAFHCLFRTIFQPMAAIKTDISGERMLKKQKGA